MNLTLSKHPLRWNEEGNGKIDLWFLPVHSPLERFVLFWGFFFLRFCISRWFFIDYEWSLQRCWKHVHSSHKSNYIQTQNKNGCTDLYRLKLLSTEHKSNVFPMLKCLLWKYSRCPFTRYSLEEHEEEQDQRFVPVSDIFIPPEVLPLKHGGQQEMPGQFLKL